MIARNDQFGLATGNPAADAFLRENPTAVLMGVPFDQRIRAEMAFAGPYRLFERLGQRSHRWTPTISRRSLLSPRRFTASPT